MSIRSIVQFTSSPAVVHVLVALVEGLDGESLGIHRRSDRELKKHKRGKRVKMTPEPDKSHSGSISQNPFFFLFTISASSLDARIITGALMSLRVSIEKNEG